MVGNAGQVEGSVEQKQQQQHQLIRCIIAVCLFAFGINIVVVVVLFSIQINLLFVGITYFGIYCVLVIWG